jgi:hypothetical protein
VNTPDPKLCEHLAKIAEEQGFAHYVERDWVILPDSGLMLTGYVEKAAAGSAGSVVLAVSFRIIPRDETNRWIPIIGYGTNHEQALKDSCESFLNWALRAIARSYLCTRAEDAIQHNIPISGQQRVVTFGPIQVHTQIGKTIETPGSRHGAPIDCLQYASLRAGTHWLDIYQAHVDDRTSIEIRLDNERWGWLENQLSREQRPAEAPFVSVRQLLIIQDIDDPIRAR